MVILAERPFRFLSGYLSSSHVVFRLLGRDKTAAKWRDMNRGYEAVQLGYESFSHVDMVIVTKWEGQGTTSSGRWGRGYET